MARRKAVNMPLGRPARSNTVLSPSAPASWIISHVLVRGTPDSSDSACSTNVICPRHSARMITDGVRRPLRCSCCTKRSGSVDSPACSTRSSVARSRAPAAISMASCGGSSCVLTRRSNSSPETMFTSFSVTCIGSDDRETRADLMSLSFEKRFSTPAKASSENAAPSFSVHASTDFLRAIERDHFRQAFAQRLALRDRNLLLRRTGQHDLDQVFIRDDRRASSAPARR